MIIAHVATWAICALSLLGIVLRPRGIAEWVWACAGATALLALRLLAPRDAAQAIAQGLDVYLFLVGMMLLAEFARAQGVFAWFAMRAVRAARGSTARLFLIAYGVGVAVTIVLSNDATAIVLTPAVASAARRANVSPLPFVYACAFVSNAASFVLPISNPANLIVFAGAMPALAAWLGALLLPSLAAIGVTYATLTFLSRKALRRPMAPLEAPAVLGRGGRVVLWGIVASSIALCTVSALRGPIGIVTACSALLVAVIIVWVEPRSIAPALRQISWSILPLVAGLFVLVRGLEVAGTLAALRSALAPLSRAGGFAEIAALGIGTGLLTNLSNNLPLGVVTGQILGHGGFSQAGRYAAAIGVDLGPNLSITGSLATILWLVALRRAGIGMTGAQFLRVGALVMPSALLAALATLAACTHASH